MLRARRRASSGSDNKRALDAGASALACHSPSEPLLRLRPVRAGTVILSKTLFVLLLKEAMGFESRFPGRKYKSASRIAESFPTSCRQSDHSKGRGRKDYTFSTLLELPSESTAFVTSVIRKGCSTPTMETRGTVSQGALRFAMSRCICR